MPINKAVSNAPQHALPLIQTLMDLIGAEKLGQGSKSPTTNTPPTNTNNTNSNNLKTPSQPIQHTSPMSVHAIVDWGNTDNLSSSPSQQQQQETFVPNNVSTAAWQQLFATAATPFFENDLDWQGKNILIALVIFLILNFFLIATLSSLFDENQNKQSNLFM